MSREEAREMVDFINKAVDVSILRTLVRSPVKDGKRGRWLSKFTWNAVAGY